MNYLKAERAVTSYARLNVVVITNIAVLIFKKTEVLLVRMPNSLNFSGHLDIYHVDVWCENADVIFGQLLVIAMFESSFDQIVFSINLFFPEKNVPRTTIMISQSAHLIFFVFREKLVGVVLHRLVFRPYSLPSWKMIFSVNFFVKWQQNVKLSVSKSVLTENVNFWKERSFANWGHLK